jgi:hypothetical protein
MIAMTPEDQRIHYALQRRIGEEMSDRLYFNRHSAAEETEGRDYYKYLSLARQRQHYESHRRNVQLSEREVI